MKDTHINNIINLFYPTFITKNVPLWCIFWNLQNDFELQRDNLTKRHAIITGSS